MTFDSRSQPQTSPKPDKYGARQGQQSSDCQHYVHHGTITAALESPLEILEDRRHRIVRMSTQDPRRCPGYGLRHVHQPIASKCRRTSSLYKVKWASLSPTTTLLARHPPHPPNRVSPPRPRKAPRRRHHPCCSRRTQLTVFSPTDSKRCWSGVRSVQRCGGSVVVAGTVLLNGSDFALESFRMSYGIVRDRGGSLGRSRN